MAEEPTDHPTHPHAEATNPPSLRSIAIFWLVAFVILVTAGAVSLSSASEGDSLIRNPDQTVDIERLAP